MSTNSQVVASGAEGQANINLWLQDISPWCPGVHRSVMKRQLLLAIREFFEQSWGWRQTLGPITLIANQPTYMLSPFNSTTDVVGVIGVTVNGLSIQPLQSEPAYPPAPVGTVQGAVDLPFGYYMLRPDVIALAPPPNPTDPTNPPLMQVYVALRPKMSVGQVPKIAVTDFYDPIMNGALYRLLSQPAKPYSNPQLAAYFENKFRRQIAQAAGKAKKGFANAPSWRFPYFGSAKNFGKGGW
jgi:hypothetical protein